ncbi:MAG: hypothetical protein RJA44_1360 [Pseudomonadota bacterium]
MDARIEPARPLCLILLISADESYRTMLQTALQQAALRLDHEFELQILAVAEMAQGLQAVRDDGRIQLVLIDHASAPAGAAIGCVQQLAALRPELSLYLLLQDDDTRLLVEPLAGAAIEGYFQRSEPEPGRWLRILAAEVAAKAATPFYDQLRAYVALAKDSWHTPGHAGGEAYQGSAWVADYADFVGAQMLRADLSVSVPALDSLLHPTGVIAQAQQLAARAFGARQTYFATNGTSTANKIILQTLLAPGDRLLLDRNCHKSVHHAVILSGARPVYLEASVHAVHGLYGPVPQARLLEAIERHRDARALILTSCTYDGLRYDLAPIIQAAHAHGIKVVVDEAWYAHARFHPALRPTALECGADYVTQSTHKVLSAFSQASMIHVNDPDFDAHCFREHFNMHASTSPQYNLIASLDVARRQAVMEGYTLLQRALGFAAELRQSINATGVLRVLDLEELRPEALRDDPIRLDPTKLTIDIRGCGRSAEALRRELIERHHIQIEKHTATTLTLLVSLGSTRSKVSRLFDAMLRLARHSAVPAAGGATRHELSLPQLTRLACLPRDAFYARGERLALLDAQGLPNPALAGRICCDQIVPYPPGIPVLVPGQLIEAEVLAWLARLLRRQPGAEVHGLAELGGEVALRVLDHQDSTRLAPVDQCGHTFQGGLHS